MTQTPTTHATYRTPQQANKNPSTPLRHSVLSARTEIVAILFTLVIVLLVVFVAVLHALTIFIDAFGNSFIFSLLLPGAAVTFAALVPVLGNPIHALLCLLGLFAATALIYLSQGAEYLALVFLIVYVGALAILFLFVIMLLNVKDIMSVQQSSMRHSLSRKIVVAVCSWFAVHTVVTVHNGFEKGYLLSPAEISTPTLLEEMQNYVTSDILKLRELYTKHWALFILVTAILLTAMIGAIVVATTHAEFEDKKPVVAAAATSALTAEAQAAVILSETVPRYTSLGQTLLLLLFLGVLAHATARGFYFLFTPGAGLLIHPPWWLQYMKRRYPNSRNGSCDPRNPKM